MPITHQSVLSLWPLTTDHCYCGRSGLFGPPLCGGSAPATPPLLKPPAAPSVWQYDLDDPLRPNFPRVLADSEYVPAQARQARQLPYVPNVHRFDHREPATEILTVHSAQTDRKQYTHRTWLSSYHCSRIAVRMAPNAKLFHCCLYLAGPHFIVGAVRCPA